MRKILTALSFVIFSSACSDDDCKQSDRCGLEPEVGNCRAAINKFYFDKTTGKCMVFSWGGCNGVVPFDTLEECENQCECKGKEY